MRIFKSKWGKWMDLQISKVQETVFLLQYRRHKNGLVQFRVEKSKPIYGGTVPDIEKLKAE